jgi:hypothetical protein
MYSSDFRELPVWNVYDAHALDPAGVARRALEKQWQYRAGSTFFFSFPTILFGRA